MTATTRIGEGRFATPLDLLANERVLWAGAPARRSFWVLFGRWQILWLIPLGFLLLAVMLPRKEPSEDDTVAATRPGVEASARCAAAPVDPCAPGAERAATAQATATPGAEPNEEDSGPQFWQILLGLLVLFTLYQAVECWLRLRNGWYVITSERICIQSGGFSKMLTVIDLDKVVSVQAYATWVEALLRLQTIELTHAGGAREYKAPINQYLGPNPYALIHVEARGTLLSDLVNHWLPRDDRR